MAYDIGDPVMMMRQPHIRGRVVIPPRPPEGQDIGALWIEFDDMPAGFVHANQLHYDADRDEG